MIGTALCMKVSRPGMIISGFDSMNTLSKSVQTI